MEAAFEFAVNGENMEFALYHLRDGHTVPARLFIDIIAKKVPFNKQTPSQSYRSFSTNGQYHQYGSFN